MNDQNEQIIKKVTGPCVVLAGAGTGKTYAIAEKIKYLITSNIYNPEKIICITFSNEAANNLLSRVRKNLPETKNEPVIKTFHAFSADLLRKHGKKIQIQENFKVLDPDQAKIVIHTNFKIHPGLCHRYISSIGIAKDLGIKTEDLEIYLEKKLKKYSNIDLEKYLESLQFESQTSYLKGNNQFNPQLTREIEAIESLIKLKKFVNSWKAYEKIKLKRGYQDYSDLNNNALLLLKKFPEISFGYDYIIVDEFQDTNKVQLDLLLNLARHKNITVVGDLNQCIYRFRGAYKENLSEFRKMFNVEKNDIFTLQNSYRSSNKILKTAHKLILNNYENKEDCFEVKNFENREGEKIEIYELKNEKEEARKIVELIENEIKNGTLPEEICIMCRTHQQTRVIKNLLEMKKIDFSSASKNPLLKNNLIKTTINYLKILEKLKTRKKGGEKAWWDLIFQSNFSESDLIKIGKFIRENTNAENISALLLNSMQTLDLSEAGKLAAKILVEKIKILIPQTEKPIEELIASTYNIAGFIKNNETKEEKTATLNLNKFYEVAKEQRELHDAGLSEFTHYLDVLNALDIEIVSPEVEKSGVRLMTSHSTKGSEYKIVIVTNLAQKRFPIIKFAENSPIPFSLNPELSELKNLDEDEAEYYVKEHETKNQLFDERRLCYVSFTRAKEKLILTYAENYGAKKLFPSQFLDEVNYKNNPDLIFFIDDEEKYEKPEQHLKVLLPKTDSKNLEKEVATDKINFKFSPSSLRTFDECEKKFEYKYVYNMPEEKTINWEALQLGSFVHLILEKGVKNNFSSLKEFLDLAKEIHAQEEWSTVEFEEAIHMIKVFFERHKNRYNKNSKTEQALPFSKNGINFIGYADRIDFHNDGIEIIDYKTGKSILNPKDRNWQLGYYALAAAPLGKVKKINLEMLRDKKPLEFEIDKQGNAVSTNAPKMHSFNIYDVEEELTSTAKKILEAFKTGFKVCPIEKNCPFCEEYIYS